ncbi:hypothetical protein ACFYOV_16920 [Streptomyces sp. NPDC005931]|uniref:hypothetical protein n=1 Tax=Streptomyces sp. NPDC005931 TaxID=3364737 RepID=UPI0036CC0E68
MQPSRFKRAGGALGHLLLVALLALGVLTMHTLGHPDHSSAPATSVAAPRAPEAHSELGGTGTPHAAHGEADGRATDPARSSSTHDPVTGTNPTGLCVAVLLGAWVLAALVRAALAGRHGWSAGLVARLGAVLRAGPPPRAPDLTRLSVLRL